MELIKDSKEAYLYLEKGEILMSPGQLILFMKDKQVYVKAPQWTAKLDKNDFLELFKTRTFSIYEKREETDSSQKDEEYYQWRSHYL